MAKTAKLKNSTKPSTHSRASRRASSPSLNLDKSLKPVPRPSSSNVLGVHTSAGISKAPKKKGAKALKRKQKLRVEQGKEKAEAVIGKLERKIKVATRQREGKKGRNADWDELNEKIAGKKRTKKDKGNKNEDGWEDEPMAVNEEPSSKNDNDGTSTVANGVETLNDIEAEAI